MNSKKILASIITIGDELLIGQTIDTNSAWIARELNEIGIWVHRRLAVGDLWNDIWKALDEEGNQSSIVLITGGLGPTADDITKPLLCEYFQGKMVVDQGALENVKNIFENILKKPMIERNLKQAEVPDVCQVIPNKRGTAPGMLFEKETAQTTGSKTFFISMPGVPHEMKGMMSNYVLPMLRSSFHLKPVIHKTMITAGLGESFLAERIKNFEASLPNTIKLAYLPNYGMVKLRLTASDNNPATAEILNDRFDELYKLLKDIVVTDEDKTLQEVVGNILKQSGKTVCTAESCTGGFLAHQLTSIPGSSAYFNGSVVSYSNAAKENLLQVPADCIEQHGAVSESTVRFMVQGALAALKSDYAVATSGIMGPGGGSEEKPVGTVWIAVGNQWKTEARKFHFRFDRQRNIELTAVNALNMLRMFLQEQHP